MRSFSTNKKNGYSMNSERHEEEKAQLRQQTDLQQMEGFN